MANKNKAFFAVLCISAASLIIPTTALAANEPVVKLSDVKFNKEAQTAESLIDITKLEKNKTYSIYTYTTCADPEKEKISNAPSQTDISNKTQYKQSITVTDAVEMTDCEKPGFLVKVTPKDDEKVLVDKASPKIPENLIKKAALTTDPEAKSAPPESETTEDSATTIPSSTSTTVKTSSSTSTSETTTSKTTKSSITPSTSKVSETTTDEETTSITTTPEKPSSKTSAATTTTSSSSPSSNTNPENTQELGPKERKLAESQAAEKSSSTKNSTITKTETTSVKNPKPKIVKEESKNGKLLVSVVNEKGEPVSGVTLKMNRIDSTFTENMVSVGQTSTLNVPVGKFLVERVGIPEGYIAKKSTSQVTVDVHADKTTKVTFILVTAPKKHVEKKPVEKKPRTNIMSIPSGPIKL